MSKLIALILSFSTCCHILSNPRRATVEIFEDGDSTSKEIIDISTKRTYGKNFYADLRRMFPNNSDITVRDNYERLIEKSDRLPGHMYVAVLLKKLASAE